MSILNRWIKRTFRTDGVMTRKPKRRQRSKLNLETLEERWVPTTPSVTSISYFSPGGQYTNSSTLTWAVTFSEPVVNVAPSDFQVVNGIALKETSTIGVSPVSSSVYDVSVNVAGSGTAQLNLVNNHTIVSVSSSSPLSNSYSGPAYSVDQQGPVLQSITRSSPSGSVTNATSVTYAVTFSQPVTGVNASDFTVVTGNPQNVSPALTANPTVALSGGPTVYAVTVSGISGDGTVGLNFVQTTPITSVATGASLVSSGPVHFGTAQTYHAGPATGSYPQSVVVADVNGDGIPDLIVTNKGSGSPYGSTVSVLIGNGDGTFQAQVTYSVGSAPYGVAVGDLNGDGYPDLVVANFAGYGSSSSPKPGSISVLLNNGNGTFQAQQTYATGGTPPAAYGGETNEVAIADVNHDGIPDLVVTNRQDLQVTGFPGVASVLLGNGDGTFQAQQTYQIQFLPKGQFVAADLTGDGYPDIVTDDANYGVSVLINKGDGTGSFLSHQTYGTGGAYGVTSADLNGDGIPDLLVTAKSGIAILFGNGNGTFKPEQTVSTSLTGLFSTVSNTPGFATSADINGDGIPDIVALAGSNVTVLLGNGNGTFQAPQTFATGVGGTWMSVADLNGDGTPDVVIANSNNAGTVTVLMGLAGAGTVVGPSYTIEQTPTVSITSEPTSYSSTTSPSFSFVANNPAVGGPGNQTNHIQYQLDFGGFMTTTSPLNLSGLSLGSHTIQFEAVDTNGDTGPATSYTWTIGTTPLINSVNRLTPSAATTSASTLVYQVVFSEPVTGVGPSDFKVLTTGTTMANSPVAVSGSGTTYTVTITGVHGDGTLQLDLINNTTIKTVANGTPLGGSANFQGQIYNIQQVNPSLVSIVQTTPPTEATNATSVTYTVTFSEPVFGVSSSNFSIGSYGSVATSSISVSGSGAVYTVTINGINGNGDIILNLANVTGIHDGNGNPIINTPKPAFQSETTLSTGTAFTASILSASVAAGGVVTITTSPLPAGSSYQIGQIVVIAGVNGTGSAANRYNGTFPITSVSGNTFTYTSSPSATGSSTNNGTAQITSTPTAIASADLIGNGKQDLIVASPNSSATNSLNVYLGNGNGTFQAPTSYSVPDPTSVTVADLNGDGIPDILVGSGNSYTVSILFGNGDGTFQAPVAISAGQYPKAVAVADVNGDGIADIVVADYGHISGAFGVNNAVGVLLGNGNGTFQAEQTYISGVEPSALAVGDLNGDGHLDIAVTNQKNSTVGVLLNNGDGTFQAQVAYTAGINPVSVAIGDINNDGFPDLVTAQEGTAPGFAAGSIDVFLANGDGTFQNAQSFTVSKPTQVAIADVTGDGVPDIVFNSYNSNFVEVIPSTGPGSFGTKQSFFTGPHPAAFVLADVTGDGLPDIVTADNNPNTIGVLASTFAPVLQTQTPIKTAAPNPNKVAIGDVNGDGIPDLVFTQLDSAFGLTIGQGNIVNVMLGNGNGTYKPAVSYATGGYSATQVQLADLNGDGHPDIVITDSPNMFSTPPHLAGFSVLMNNGNGTFQAPVTYEAALSGTLQYPSFAQIADINGDGHPDILFTSSVGNNVGVMLNNGDGTFKAEQTVATFPTNTKPTAFAYADVTGDGIPDLVIVNSGGGSGATLVAPGLMVLVGNGNGTFQAPVTYSVGVTTASIAPNFVAVGDLNGDGHPDIAVTNATGGGLATISVLMNNGNGTFQAAQSYFVAGRPVWIAEGDLTGDGKPDLVVANTLGVQALLGNGDGTFQQPQFISAGSYATQVAILDANGDGAPDVLFGYSNNSNVFVIPDKVYEIDQTPPTVQITGEPPATTPSTTATFTFTGTDPKVGGVASGVSYFQYSLDGSPYMTATSPLTLTGLSTGSHTFNVEAVDAAGNASTPASYTWMITTNPITISSIAVDGSTAPILSASASGGVVTITTDGASGFTMGQSVLIAGVDGTGTATGFNGAFTISGVSGNTFTYSDAGATGASSSSGTATTTGTTGLLSNGATSFNSQRSMVDSVVYTFNQAVNLGANAVTISVLGQGGVVPTVAYASPDGGVTWVVTFSGSGVVGNSIANGEYQIVLNSSAVSAVSGSGTLAGNDTESFYRLYGDTVGNGHQRVNTTDTNAFLGTFNLRSTAAGFLAFLDSNNDGRINTTDTNAFLGDFNIVYRNFTASI